MAWMLALATVVLDQLSKAWVMAHLGEGQAQTLVPGLLDLRLVHNTGAAFSLLSGSTQLLALVSGLVSALLVWILISRPPERLRPALALGWLLGGAVGNGLDRWRLGSVVDVLALVPVSFPVFNLADVAINLAVVAYLLDLLADRTPPSSHD
ncbi:MAG: signal peptidase II [Cyanobacteriota bacterium]|nr:signal peptidase II [Cyanobacteriota bacterium]